MRVSIFMIFAIFGIVARWAETALEDGKVTLLEAVQLVTELASILGIRTELEIPTEPSMLPPEIDEQESAPDAEAEPESERPPPT